MANEKRLIDANALKQKMLFVRLYVASLRCGKTIICKILESYRSAVFEEIDNAPTVDAVEVVHGRWMQARYTEAPLYICSECDKTEYKEHNYCPNCGAKMMDGDGNGN